ncbi:uncharacterized protein LOC110432570 isoform X1 [Sorghum bicolor]|uniref:uncharacterized protein LOC110432570 isoform X1 n=1 Tax=Sorghum bicolor TaxID=4558 RepID=UPI000B425F9C|nr:uncharacterized protein LOC110432570 isoform X1 [Sorghum bicolor]XP_021308968.1 uncharacterized protein LOC110432570 isoform X1 [Sorghum bicolor]XP_021308971.1 uncharacterized protein LOC110432570 isoform X1 [Sorghum bicolor]|eukprot:XP_021308967.1 uncharacterized protein LOC110432570 isoform X1 [Sorghum bicolor]
MCQFRISLMRVKLADISNFGTTLWKLIKDFNVTDLNNIHYPNCKLVHSSGKATKISTLSMTFLELMTKLSQWFSMKGALSLQPSWLMLGLLTTVCLFSCQQNRKR